VGSCEAAGPTRGHTTRPGLLPLLRPYPADEMQVAEVGPAVNSPKNDGPECLDAA
jgi:putative SOS response-associated peptidase YedK